MSDTRRNLSKGLESNHEKTLIKTKTKNIKQKSITQNNHCIDLTSNCDSDEPIVIETDEDEDNNKNKKVINNVYNPISSTDFQSSDHSVIIVDIAQRKHEVSEKIYKKPRITQKVECQNIVPFSESTSYPKSKSTKPRHILITVSTKNGARNIHSKKQHKHASKLKKSYSHRKTVQISKHCKAKNSPSDDSIETLTSTEYCTCCECLKIKSTSNKYRLKRRRPENKNLAQRRAKKRRSHSVSVNHKKDLPKSERHVPTDRTAELSQRSVTSQDRPLPKCGRECCRSSRNNISKNYREASKMKCSEKKPMKEVSRRNTMELECISSGDFDLNSSLSDSDIENLITRTRKRVQSPLKRSNNKFHTLLQKVQNEDMNNEGKSMIRDNSWDSEVKNILSALDSITDLSDIDFGESGIETPIAVMQHDKDIRLKSRKNSQVDKKTINSENPIKSSTDLSDVDFGESGIMTPTTVIQCDKDVMFVSRINMHDAKKKLNIQHPPKVKCSTDLSDINSSESDIEIPTAVKQCDKDIKLQSRNNIQVDRITQNVENPPVKSSYGTLTLVPIEKLRGPKPNLNTIIENTLPKPNPNITLVVPVQQLKVKPVATVIPIQKANFKTIEKNFNTAASDSPLPAKRKKQKMDNAEKQIKRMKVKISKIPENKTTVKPIELNIKVGTILNNRFDIREIIKRGSFANVVRAIDKQSGDKIILKILHRKKYSHMLYNLKLLNGGDPVDRFHCVRLNGQFYLDGHLALWLESYCWNLKECLQKLEHGRGFPFASLQILSRQLLLAVQLLREHNLLHGDIRPEHILINSSNTNIKLTGFDGARQIKKSPGVVTLTDFINYQAPEIILNFEFDYSIDVWSAACVTYEMATGKQPFSAGTENEVLWQIMNVNGKFPDQMKVGKHFDKNGNFLHEHVTCETEQVTSVVREIQPNGRRDLKSELTEAYKVSSAQDAKCSSKLVHLLGTALHTMLLAEPSRRVTVDFALLNQFFQVTP